MTEDARQLTIIAAVSADATKIEAQITDIAAKLETTAARLMAALWRKKAGTSYKSLLKSIQRLAYDAGMADENLMRLLFKLDGVLGEEEVRTKRKAEVVRIKDLIKRAETLRQRALKLERMLKKASNSVQWENIEEKKAEDAAAAAATASQGQQSQSQQQQEQQQAVPMETKTADQPSTAPPSQDSESSMQVDQQSSPSESKQQQQQLEQHENRPQSPPESKSSQDQQDQRPGSSQRSARQANKSGDATGEQQQQQTKSPLKQQNKASSDDLDTTSDSETVGAHSRSPAKSSQTSKAESKQQKKPKGDSKSKQSNENDKAGVDFRTKYGKLPQWTPQFQERETRDAVLVLADLDGVEDEDLTININEGILTVRGVKKPTQEDLHYHRMFGYDPRSAFGWFERKFQIPASLDGDKATAEFRNGTLKITLPKKQQPAAPRQARPVPVSQQHQRNPFWGRQQEQEDEQEPEAEADEESVPYTYAMPRRAARPRYRNPAPQFNPFGRGSWGSDPFGGFW